MEEKWRLIVGATTIAIVLSVWATYVVYPLVQLPDDYSYHSSEVTRIRIDGDEDFTSANGVVSGVGSLSDPYVISFPEADYHQTTIEISNTTLSFVLRDSTFTYSYLSGCIPVSETGITISNATGFLVEDNEGSCSVNGCDDFTLCGNSMSADIANCSHYALCHNRGGTFSSAYCTDFSVRENINLTLMLESCRNSAIIDNRFDRGTIAIGNSSDCTVDSNRCQSITVDGGSADCLVANNSILNNSFSMGWGIFLDCVHDVTLDRNTIDNCSYHAIELWRSVKNCTISRNNISNCYGGITLRDAEGCHVYHNNMFSSFWSGGYMLSDPLDSEYHAGGVLDEQGWLNSWDNGYPDGGNYYFDYNGLDLYSGQLQDTLGGDGIGDTPLVIYTYLDGTPAEDHYPLMAPYGG